MRDPIKVVHVMRTYGVRGGEQQVSQFFMISQHSRLDQSFVSLFSDKKCAELLKKRAPSLKYSTLSKKSPIQRKAWGELFQLLFPYIYLVLKFRRILVGEKPNIIVAHGFQAALICWPLLITKHGFKSVYVQRAAKADRLINWYFKLLYKPFDILVGNSHAVADSLLPFANKTKIRVVENGINFEEFRERQQDADGQIFCKSGKKILVTVGELFTHKGHLVLVEAMSRIKQKCPDCELWIVGEGPIRNTIEGLVDNLGLRGDVVLLGQISNIPKILSLCDLFLFASSSEGMSNAVLEAMAAGLPSVVVDAPGVSECHEAGKTGIIVKRNPDEIANAVLKLIANNDLLQKIGLNARHRVSNKYSMENNLNSYEKVFSEMLRI